MRIPRLLYLIMIGVFPLAAVAQTSPPPSLTSTTCSASGLTSITSGLVSGISLYPASGATFTYTSTISSCSASPYSDAHVILSGWKWTQATQTTKLCDIRVDLQRVSFNATSNTLTWNLALSLNDINTTTCGEVVDDARFDVHFQIVATTDSVSRVIPVSNSCSDLTYDGCDGAKTEAGVISTSPKHVFGGVVLTGFKLSSAANGGTEINRMYVNIYGSPSGPDVTWNQNCYLGLSSSISPQSGISCDVDAAILTIDPSELMAAQQFTVDDSGAARQLSESGGFSFPIKNLSPGICGLHKFDLHFQSTNSHPIWSVWAGASAMDCGPSPGPVYNGNYFANLGAQHPGSPLPPPPWPTDWYRYSFILNGLQFQ